MAQMYSYFSSKQNVTISQSYYYNTVRLLNQRDSSIGFSSPQIEVPASHYIIIIRFSGNDKSVGSCEKSGIKVSISLNFCIFAVDMRKILTYGGYFEHFLGSLAPKEVLTQKTPRKEIEKALKLKEAYYEDKQS